MPSPTSSTRFSFATEASLIETDIAQTDLDAALADSVDRIETTIRNALASAEVTTDAIDTLILTGGSTQVPVVSRRIRELLPNARAVSTDAFGSVGLGLALDAKRKFA